MKLRSAKRLEVSGRPLLYTMHTRQDVKPYTAGMEEGFKRPRAIAFLRVQMSMILPACFTRVKPITSWPSALMSRQGTSETTPRVGGD